jgi:hypothetical protein
MSDGIYVDRYAVRYVEFPDGSWSMSKYRCNEHGSVEGVDHVRGEGSNSPSKPEWLRTIVDVATVAGAFMAVTHPPPNRILWFEMTPGNKLIKFTEDIT